MLSSTQKKRNGSQSLGTRCLKTLLIGLIHRYSGSSWLRAASKPTSVALQALPAEAELLFNRSKGRRQAATPYRSPMAPQGRRERLPAFLECELDFPLVPFISLNSNYYDQETSGFGSNSTSGSPTPNPTLEASSKIGSYFRLYFPRHGSSYQDRVLHARPIWHFGGTKPAFQLGMLALSQRHFFYNSRDYLGWQAGLLRDPSPQRASGLYDCYCGLQFGLGDCLQIEADLNPVTCLARQLLSRKGDPGQAVEASSSSSSSETLRTYRGSREKSPRRTGESLFGTIHHYLRPLVSACLGENEKSWPTALHLRFGLKPIKSLSLFLKCLAPQPLYRFDPPGALSKSLGHLFETTGTFRNTLLILGGREESVSKSEQPVSSYEEELGIPVLLRTDLVQLPWLGLVISTRLSVKMGAAQTNFQWKLNLGLAPWNRPPSPPASSGLLAAYWPD